MSEKQKASENVEAKASSSSSQHDEPASLDCSAGAGSGNYDEKYYTGLGVDLALVQKWKNIQETLRTKVILEDIGLNFIENVKLIAGLDISYPKDAHSKGNCEAITAIVICKYPSFERVYEEVEEFQLINPYVPGFLAFRELPALISLTTKVINAHPSLKPDLILIDGNGLLHPQECGLACQLGLEMDIPTIGVAKNLFHVDGLDLVKKDVQDLENVGDFMELRKGNTGKVLGIALKTCPNIKNPIYVSVGHKISLETAKSLVLLCSKFRVPEPIRFADHLSREHIRQMSIRI